MSESTFYVPNIVAFLILLLSIYSTYKTMSALESGL